MILVLEDNPDRLSWLRRFTRDRVRIEAFSRVLPFLSRLPHVSPSLVILDHDLVSDSLNGYDAARGLTRHMTARPVLVWSQNPPGAANIASWLLQFSWMQTFVAPFGSERVREVVAQYGA